MFTAALFIVANIWKLPKRQKERSRRYDVHMHTHIYMHVCMHAYTNREEYYSVIKRIKLTPSEARVERDFAKQKGRRRKINTREFHLFIGYLENTLKVRQTNFESDVQI